MTYTAKITLKFDSTWDFKGGIYDDEILPEQHITMEVPAEDLNSIQLFKLWENFLQAMGHNEVGIMKGACYIAFNDMRSDKNMRKIANEFDIKMMEDHYEIVAELQDEIIKLKAKIFQLEQPDNDTDIYDEQYGAWNGLVPGTDEAYAKGCKCPILDNQNMPDGKKWVNGDCPIHGKNAVH
jgi:hypothetical protein